MKNLLTSKTPAPKREYAGEFPPGPDIPILHKCFQKIGKKGFTAAHIMK